jgi:hypothetical protein
MSGPWPATVQSRRMPKGVMVVMTEPVAGRDDEFNEWYDNVHVPEMLKVPGVSAAQRFVAVPSNAGVVPAQRYMTIYEFDVDIDDALSNLTEARPRTTRHISDALDESASVVYAFRAMGARIEASNSSGRRL